MKLTNYSIKIQTFAIKPLWNECGVPYAKVYESNRTVEVSKSAYAIIVESLRENGQTFRGAKEGTCALIGSVQLPPITINEVHGIYWLYTAPPHKNTGKWLALHAIHRHKEADDGSTIVTLINGQILWLEISFKAFEKKMKNATLLKIRREQRTLFMLYHQQAIAENREDYHSGKK